MSTVDLKDAQKCAQKRPQKCAQKCAQKHTQKRVKHTRSTGMFWLPRELRDNSSLSVLPQSRISVSLSQYRD